MTFRCHLDGYYDVAEQMNLDLRRRAAIHFRRQAQEKAMLETIEQFEAHRKQIRDSLLLALGGLPGPNDAQSRTSLNARITGVVECEHFSIEKVLFESLPNFFVTAACYVPKNLTAAAPAVIFAQGHIDIGKSYPFYQAVCSDLARNGLVVLTVDPIGQGERAQYFAAGERVSGPSVHEHTRAGLPFWLCGSNVARQFVWDLMRGIDYLESRRDVDKTRIAITGNSGGGTQSSLMMVLEPRLAAAMPCTFIATLDSFQKTGQVQDPEQIFYRAMTEGPDHDDFLTAMAPKPVLVGAVTYDFFPIEGTLEAFERAKRIYGLFGRPENLHLATDDSVHQYTPLLRRACVDWFCRHLTGTPPRYQNDEPVILPGEKLWVTSGGQVLADFPHSRTIFDLIGEEVPLNGARQPFSQLRTRLAQSLTIKEAGDRSTPIHARVISETDLDGYRTEKLFFFSAPDIAVTGVIVHPLISEPGSALPTVMLLFEKGTDELPSSRSRLESLLRHGRRVFVFDVRGVGGVEARVVNDRDDFLDTEYKVGCDALMLGLSTLGQRVFDVLRGYDYLRTRADVASIHLHGVGASATYAFFAAALEMGFASVTCEKMLYSYRDWCQTRLYDQQLCDMRILAWGLLRDADIVDLLPTIAPRPLRFINPRNALGQTMTATSWREKFLDVARLRGYMNDGWQPQLLQPQLVTSFDDAVI